jgi:hypothetical protein
MVFFIKEIIIHSKTNAVPVKNILIPRKTVNKI